MRVDSLSTSQISRLDPGHGVEPARRAEQRTAEPVALSPLGSLMLAAQQALRDLPATRESRVRELGDQLGAGRYQPDPEAVTAAMFGAEGA